jgi:cytochrome c2
VGRKKAASFALVLILCVLCSACSKSEAPLALTIAGNPGRGRDLMERYGCAACHTIPGVRRAVGLVGPPLSGLARRAYIAGVAANTPQNLVQWIMSPQSFNPRTAMPAVGAGEAQARDMAAYLYLH